MLERSFQQLTDFIKCQLSKSIMFKFFDEGTVYVNLVIYETIPAEEQSNGHVTELTDDTGH